MALNELLHATGLVEPIDTSELLHTVLDAGEGLTVQVASDPCNLTGYAVGHSLWTAAPELIDFLAAAVPAGGMRGKRVIELGAGLGSVGNAMALRGASVTVTDLPAALQLLCHNVELNQGSTCAEVAVELLVWGRPLPAATVGAFDFLLASDVCYDSDCYGDLLQTISDLCACNASMQVLLSLPDRRETRDFFPLAVSRGFAWRVLRRVRRPDLVHDIHIYQLVPIAAAAPRSAAPQAPRVLAVWDFDWSLVEENSDTWVLDRLGATPIFQRLRHSVEGWTSLMDACLSAAAAELGADESAVRGAARSTPISPAIVQAVTAAAASGAVEQLIVSDANTVYISELLHEHGLQGCFSEVITNPADFEQGALQVRPHHAQPHGCLLCPSNLCKGQVLRELLLRHPFERIVYVGDGRGDFCPCTMLGPNDVIMSRDSYPDSRPTSLLQLLTAEEAAIRTPAATAANGGSRATADRSTGRGADATAADSASGKPENSDSLENMSRVRAKIEASATLPSPPSEQHLADHEPRRSASLDGMDVIEALDAIRTGDWPKGDVAAPVFTWSTPAECAPLWRRALRPTAA